MRKIILFIIGLLLVGLVLIGGGCGDGDENGDKNGDKNGGEDCQISWQCSDWSDYMCGNKWRFCKDINECKEYYTDKEMPENFKSLSYDEKDRLYSECMSSMKEKCDELNKKSRQASDCYFDCSDECVFISYEQHDACRAQCSKTCQNDEAGLEYSRCLRDEHLKAIECHDRYKCGYYVSGEMSEAGEKHDIDGFNQAIENEIQKRIQEEKDREGWD